MLLQDTTEMEYTRKQGDLAVCRSRWNRKVVVAQILTKSKSHGTRTCIKRKKLPMVIFLIFAHKNVYRIRFQKIKIGPLKGFEKKAFFSLLLMRKRLSGGQKWFLKPYFPIIRGKFVSKTKI